MCSVPSDVTASERARWLAEIAEALDDARDALVVMKLKEDERATARDLYLSIEAARMEVRSLRLSRSVSPRIIESESDQTAARQTPSGTSPPPAKGSR